MASLDMVKGMSDDELYSMTMLGDEYTYQQLVQARDYWQGMAEATFVVDPALVHEEVKIDPEAIDTFLSNTMGNVI